MSEKHMITVKGGPQPPPVGKVQLESAEKVIVQKPTEVVSQRLMRAPTSTPKGL